MTVPSGENFGKRTVSQLIYFLSYAYLDIWPSPDNYESPSIWTHQVCKIKKMPTLIFWTIFSHPDHCGKGRFWLLCNWFFLRSFQLIRHAYFTIIVIKRIKMVWIIKCPDITYLLGPCYLLFELKQVCKIKKMPTLIFWTIFSHHRNRFFLRSFQQIRNRWLIFRVLPSIQYLKCNCKKRLFLMILFFVIIYFRCP